MSTINFDFPFTAVEGQHAFKLALLLSAINPKVGGVIVSGPRGSAKSTLARALANILPFQNDQPCPFVTLPLGASVEMLTGTLNLEQALQNKRVDFSPGLLSKVDGGILYVDEVNLLADHLVDQLLDVAASGVNRIERDGISHSHRSQFSLIGTMNPDEGELREQLKDRFGLMVELTGPIDIAQRVAIVKAREAFEANPKQFIADYQLQQDALQASVLKARKLLPEIACDDAQRIDIAERCHRAGVDGLRADIVMYRAALAHAALRCAKDSKDAGNENENGVATITTKDIDAVEALVLAHRRKGEGLSNHSDSGDGTDTPGNNGDSHSQNGNEPSSDKSHSKKKGNNSKRQHSFSRPQAPDNQQSSAPSAAQSPSNSSSKDESPAQEEDWGGLQAEQKTGAIAQVSKENFQVLQTLMAQGQGPFQSGSVQRNTFKISASKVKGQSHISEQRSEGVGKQKDSINWFATIANSFQHWPALKVKYKQPQSRREMLHLVLLDTSGSTLNHRLSERAKGCVLAISKNAYLNRESIQILGFGNNQVKQLLGKVRAPKELNELLNQVSVAGATPLRKVLLQAQQFLNKSARAGNSIASQVQCYLITDGRSRSQVDDIDLGVPTVLIDTENTVVKRGRGSQLAQQLKANYFLLPA